MALIAIYQYGDLYKINWYKQGLKSKEIIKDDDIYNVDSCGKEFINDEKLANNISRAKNKVIEYGHCNEWDYFATFTINKEKQDRYDLNKFHRAFGNWIHNYNKKYNTKLKYVSIPELHGDGAVHEHALLSGVAIESLSRNEYGYLDMEYYKNRFGFISLSPIRDKTKTVFYITKYLTKDFQIRKKDLNAHTYYSSQGLKTRDCVFQGFMNIDEKILNSNMWTNDYIGIQWADSIPQYIFDEIKKLEI